MRGAGIGGPGPPGMPVTAQAQSCATGLAGPISATLCGVVRNPSSPPGGSEGRCCSRRSPESDRAECQPQPSTSSRATLPPRAPGGRELSTSVGWCLNLGPWRWVATIPWAICSGHKGALGWRPLSVLPLQPLPHGAQSCGESAQVFRRTVASAPQLHGSSAGRGCRPRGFLSFLQQHEALLLPLSQIRGLSFTLRTGARLLIHGPRFGLVPCGHWSPRAFLRHRGPCQPVFLEDTQRQ